MSRISCLGVKPQTGSRVLLVGVLLGGCALMSSALASAGEREFRGELNYETFQRAARRNETVRVSYSPGGTGAAAMALSRVSKLVIDGACNSACAWAFVRNPNACFTPRASFGFHAAHDPGTGRRLDAATQYWLLSVRGSLRGRLTGLLVSSRLIRVSANEMRQHYSDRACGAAPRTEVAALPLPTPGKLAIVEPKSIKSRKVTPRLAKLEVASAKASGGEMPVPRLDRREPIEASGRDDAFAATDILAAALSIVAGPQLEGLPAEGSRPSLWSAAVAQLSPDNTAPVGSRTAMAQGETALPGLFVAGFIDKDGSNQLRGLTPLLGMAPLEEAAFTYPGPTAAVCWETWMCAPVLSGLDRSQGPGEEPFEIAGPEIWLGNGGVDVMLSKASTQWVMVSSTVRIKSAEVAPVNTGLPLAL